MKKYIFTILGTLLLPVMFFAQTVVNVPSDLPPAEGNLNAVVQAAIDGGTLSNTVFELEPYGYYVLTGTINVPAGQTLSITAPDPGTTQATAPPQIVWTASGGVNQQYNFEVFGNISLKNVWLRYANTLGDQVGSSLQISEDPTVTEQKGNFENVIFDYSPCPQNTSSGAIGVANSHFVGTFTNCYFKNCIDAHLRYYGRAVSFPYQTTGWHTNKIEFENCTFANIGYVYMQEAGEYADDVRFNHCTFLNVVVFSLQTGWWNKMACTNSLFVNTNMFGDNPAQTGTGDPTGGTIRIDSIARFGFTPTFAQEDRRVLFTNAAYYLEPWLVDWMANNPFSKDLRRQRRNDEIPVPQPMLSPTTLNFFDSVDVATGQKAFPYFNKENLFDRTEDPGFILPPTDVELIKAYMFKKWGDNSDTNWAWKPVNGLIGLWPLEENLSYTNATLKTAAMGGFPLGDLYRWWPAEYVSWKAQAEAERASINTKLMGAVGIREDGIIPVVYSLGQNYPNPFNPTTKIEYSVPISGFVSLKVYNSLGQEVATLAKGIHQVGNYDVTFNGAGLASGIYMYQLQSDGVSITKKFVLMK